MISFLLKQEIIMSIPIHRQHDISDALWIKPEPHLPGRKGG